MVLVVVAASSVICWAMLAETALRVDAAANRLGSAEAGDLAESGVAAAIHYLRYPEQRPGALADGPDGPYVPHLSYAVGDTLVEVSVTPEGEGYRVTSSASSGGVTRTAPPVLVTRRVGMRRLGALTADKKLNLSDRWRVDGLISASADVRKPAGHTGGVAAPNGNAPAPAADLVPEDEEVHFLSQTRYPGGRALALNNRHFAGNHDARTADNPAGVVIFTGNLDVTGDLTGRGTLVVRGNLVIKNGARLDIRPEPGMPALVVRKNLEYDDGGRVVLHGPAWIGEKIETTGGAQDNAGLAVAGTLMLDDPKSDMDKKFAGRVFVAPGDDPPTRLLAPSREEIFGVDVRPAD